MRGFNDDDAYTTCSETSSETDILDEICMEEEEGNPDCLEKVNGNYYIGSISQDKEVLALSVKPYIFFNYNFEHIQQYLCEYSGLENTQETVEIIQLKIMPDLTYVPIVKTHWLRLVQKHWQHAYALRKQIIERRKTLAALHYFELHGKHIDGLHYLPSIQGLMNMY